jgi:hypothetical protein
VNGRARLLPSLPRRLGRSLALPRSKTTALVKLDALSVMVGVARSGPARVSQYTVE